MKQSIAIIATMFAISAFAQAPAAKKEEKKADAKPAVTAPAPATNIVPAKPAVAAPATNIVPATPAASATATPAKSEPAKKDDKKEPAKK